MRQQSYRKTTMPVKHFKANPWGLHDMGGNLYQWFEDRDAEYPRLDIEDTQSPQEGNKDMDCVVRGGSWDSITEYCRAAYRIRGTPANRGGAFGFRVAFRQD